MDNNRDETMTEGSVTPIKRETENDAEVIERLCAQLEKMETFIARRFDEISMEVNATSQQVDMAEEGITNKFSDVFQVLHAISYKGDGSTAANAGVELDAVVDMTEDAANRILDAAGRITSMVNTEENWSTEDARKRALEAISSDTEAIFTACSFQDITGQRIRKTLENIQTIEERLGSALDKLGIHVEFTASERVQEEYQASSQDDVDALFADQRKKDGAAE